MEGVLRVIRPETAIVKASFHKPTRRDLFLQAPFKAGFATLLGPIALWAKSAVIFLGPPLGANSLCPGQEKRTLHKPGVQIGNSGLYEAIGLKRSDDRREER